MKGCTLEEVGGRQGRTRSYRVRDHTAIGNNKAPPGSGSEDAASAFLLDTETDPCRREPFPLVLQDQGFSFIPVGHLTFHLTTLTTTSLPTTSLQMPMVQCMWYHLWYIAYSTGRYPCTCRCTNNAHSTPLLGTPPMVQVLVSLKPTKKKKKRKKGNIPTRDSFFSVFLTLLYLPLSPLEKVN